LTRRIPVTLRLSRPLHAAWKREAKSQGLTLNSFVVSGVQQGLAEKDSRGDAIDMQHVATEITFVKNEMAAMKKAFGDIRAAIEDRAYADVDLARAKDCILSILVDPESKDEVMGIVSPDKLRLFIARRNPLLERYLIPTPDSPTTLIDEILFDLQARQFVKLDEKGDITWGVRLWGA